MTQRGRPLQRFLQIKPMTADSVESQPKVFLRVLVERDNSLAIVQEYQASRTEGYRLPVPSQKFFFCFDFQPLQEQTMMVPPSFQQACQPLKVLSAATLYGPSH